MFRNFLMITVSILIMANAYEALSQSQVPPPGPIPLLEQSQNQVGNGPGFDPFSPEQAAASEHESGTLSGRFMVDNEKPLADGFIAFFNQQNGPSPEQGNFQKVPDLVVRADGAGRFSAQLPPGHYFVGGLPRPKEAMPGPPKPGENVYFIRDLEGRLSPSTVLAGQTTELGQMTGFLRNTSIDLPEALVISGIVVNEEDKPLPHAVIMIKTKLDVQRPTYIYNGTGEDGKFEIKLPAKDTYYLFAREDMNIGRPMVGSNFGAYGGENPTPLSAKAGAVISGIKLVVAKVEVPGKTQEKVEKKLNKPDDEIDATLPAPPQP